ncbi:MAG: prepilin-type N-terminal cleavage/methylation domain-containing protein [Planctomycetes bacterium]|nr:prepilin-type N-terminal cleavage/methylation domain-containing protein [Planctomycetota bacterium]
MSIHRVASARSCTSQPALFPPSSNRLARRSLPSAFTLIELLVVVAIIALLISILLPALQKARESSKAAVCGSNMHQLMLGNIHYAGDHAGHLPWIRGSLQSGYRNAPYDQFHQLIILWPYIKQLNVFKCPSAADENSVHLLYGANLVGVPGDPTAQGASHYFVRKSDDYYIATAFAENWWPDHNPFDLPAQVEEFPDLYTEYWYNDFTSSLVQGGGQTALRDAINQPLPAMNGGTIDKIPCQQFAVPMAEYGWALPAEKLRHTGAINLGYLDGHVQRVSKAKFYDLDGRAVPPGQTAQDFDAYGSRPFYAWGLTRNGMDYLR